MAVEDKSVARPGSIVNLCCKDFLTYSNVDIAPGPNLNIVIGPNGSGKSSLICAIALGLGGKPQSLGRSKHLPHYVKKGKTTSEIIIKLVAHDRSIVEIKRIIYLDKGSDWFMNGKSVNQADVTKLVHSLNIRVDNLCQFLPQDKVNQFSRLSPEELLKSTEMATGQADIYENHNQLSLLSKRIAMFNGELQAERNRLEYKVQGVNRISEDVERLQEAKRNKDKLKLFHIKQAWINYNNEAELNKSLKQQKSHYQSEIAKIEEEMAPYSSSNNEKLRNLNESFQRVKKGVRTYATQLRKIQTNDDNLNSFKDNLSEIQSDFKFQRDQERNRRLNAEHTQKIIEESEEKLSQWNKNDFQAQLSKIQEKIVQKQKENNQIQHEVNRLQQGIDQLNVERNAIKAEFTKLNDIENQKIERLRREDSDVIRAMEWIGKNKNNLPGTVEGPVALCLQLKDKAAKFVENVIRKNDLKAFVCSDNATCKILTDKLRYEMNLRVNLAVVPSEVEKKFVDLEKHRKFGFFQKLSELIDSTPMIMSYINSIYHLETTLIGTEEVRANTDAFLNSCESCVFKFFAGTSIFTVKTSNYGNKTRSTSSYEIRIPSLLGESVNDEHKTRLSNKISEFSQKLEAEREILSLKNQNHAKVNDEIRDLKKQKARIENEMQEVSTLRNRIEIQRNKLKSIESKKTSVEEIKIIMNEKIKGVYKDASKKLTHYSMAFSVMNDTIRGLFTDAHEYSKVNSAIVEIDQKHSELNNQIVTLKEELANVETEISSSKQKCTIYRAKAMEISGIKQGQQISDNLKSQLQQLPDDLPSIEEQIHVLNAKNKLASNSDERLIHDYHKEKDEINNIEKNLQISQKEIGELNEKLLKLKTHWLQDIKRIVGEISKNFSDFLQSLGYSGEVNLYSPPNENNFADYGIQILVKYRDTESLQLLDSFHQSGGERSVATILYMLALQNLTSVPFRCVDEINQGMDAVNERKVFNMIVDKACEKSKSQYFLLTPKLLKGLNYHKNLSVLCIYPKGPVTNDWNLENFSQEMLKSSQTVS